MNTKKTIFLAIAASSLSLIVNESFAADKPCGTNSALGLTDLTSSSYQYTYGNTSGSVTPSFTVSSPSLKINPSCDSLLDYVFGNGEGVDPYKAPYTISFGTITHADGPNIGNAVSSSIDTAIRTSLSAFQTPPFQLTNPGTGSQTDSFTFTDAGETIPIGSYDIEIDVAPKTGNTCGTGSQKCNGGLSAPDPVTFTLTVNEPTDGDTLPPTVTFLSPTANEPFGFDTTLAIKFTSTDPYEDGAGTGITATSAKITSCSGNYLVDDITSILANDPLLPQPANTLVTTTASVNTGDLGVGSFTLEADATDDANHTGSATVAFTVGTNIASLPPISVTGRKFNTGSTVPVKWTVTDGNGQFMPPFTDISITITDPLANIVATLFAGSGSTDIRWELDDSGNATQYITNFQIPATIGIYTVSAYLNDVCGTPASQGSFTFTAASKGGKI